MDRRSVIALLGSTLSAGCAGLGSTADGTESPTGTPPSDTPTGTEPPSDIDGNGAMPEQRWSLVEFETLPRTASLMPTTRRTDDGASLAVQFERTATTDGPARLRGTVTNENPYANTFELRRLPLFDTVPAASPGDRPHDGEYTYRDELLLAPTGNHAIAETVPDWRLASDGRWRLASDTDGPWLPETYRLAAGESFTFESALVGRREGSGFPTERYHFRAHGDRHGVGIAVWNTDEPGPTAESRFETASPPSLPKADRMAWYHEADAATTAYLEPDAERLTLPRKTTFTLRNHGRETLSGNPYYWKLWKQVDGEWFHVAPWVWPQPLTWVPPGGVQTWTLAGFTGKTVRCGDANAVGHLGGGQYAFQVGIARESRTHAALVDVEAPPVTLSPTEGLTVERDGDVITVDWPHREDEVPQATLTLTRVDSSDADDADPRLITEQVMQNRNVALRNTLAFWDEDTERVTLATDRNTVSRGARTGGYEDGSFRFRYEGTAFEAAADFDSS